MAPSSESLSGSLYISFYKRTKTHIKVVFFLFMNGRGGGEPLWIRPSVCLFIATNSNMGWDPVKGHALLSARLHIRFCILLANSWSLSSLCMAQAALRESVSMMTSSSVC